MRTILYHITPRKNLASIIARGLLPSKATGKRKAVWCLSAITPKMIQKIAKRHSVKATQLVAFEVSVTMSQFKRHYNTSAPDKMTYYTPQVIEPSSLVLLGAVI